MSRFIKVAATITAATLSGVLLFAGFPPFDLSFLPCVALVPLFLVLIRTDLKMGFVLSLICGIVFFLGIFHWILVFPGLTLVHQIILRLYLALYFGLFGLAFCLIAKRLGLAAAFLGAPFIWVSLEYIRSNVGFMALPWGLLAHSQYTRPVWIQISSLTGTYGVSFLIVLVNAGFSSLIVYALSKNKRLGSLSAARLSGRGLLAVGGSAVLCLAATVTYGMLSLSTPLEGKTLNIAVVQGNIEQDKKWDRRYARFILETYTDLTMAAAKDSPYLIIWPETATPGAINRMPGLNRRVRAIAAEASAPLLLGSARQQKIRRKKPGDRKYLNSAYLIPLEKGERPQRYDKVRLMPFGEYMPMADVIPWSDLNVPVVGSYVPGKQYTVFTLPECRFGVTICWENMFPDLVRQFVKRGAQFMVNMTNEAWFGKSAAPYQFLSMSVFRAVENRVYVIRCANTGISCVIDPNGRITGSVKDEKAQDMFVRGVLTRPVIPLDSNTFYTRNGDWFAWLSLVASIGFVLAAFMRAPLSGIKKRVES